LSKESLIRINQIILNDLENRHKGCTADDMKELIKRDIEEQKAKLKRIALL